jgi:glycine/D-amino acid oxidase-like deaminating enzyme
MRYVETAVIGQGLAGTAIAWHLANRGREFILIDEGGFGSSSQIAAGLVTPITGARNVESWAWEKAFPLASQFYMNCEKVTQSRFWKVESAIRLFVSKEERERFDNRYQSDMSGSYSNSLISSKARFETEVEQSKWRSAVQANYGGFVMPQAARLLTADFLKASRDHFDSTNRVCAASINTSTDIAIERDVVTLKSVDIQCKQIVVCEGHSALQNPMFQPIELVPAQGDILTVRIPDLKLDRVLHAGCWIAPVMIDGSNDESLYHVGSTYRWAPLNGVPNEESLSILSDKLRSFIKLPFEVIDHRAAIRPAGFDHKPLLGNHPNYSNLWILNGLGAKGVLLAPWCAEMLINAMLLHQPIDIELAWNRKRKK